MMVLNKEKIKEYDKIRGEITKRCKRYLSKEFDEKCKYKNHLILRSSEKISIKYFLPKKDFAATIQIGFKEFLEIKND